MEDSILSEDLLAIMRIVKEHGGTHCSGTCHHRRVGEFHCHTISQMLRLSSSGVKERLRNLVEIGLMERRRIIQNGHVIAIFLVSQEGEKVLAANENRSSR
ncbi:MAG: hypothetical protein ACP5SH_19995 [Syntrophobacteraceae bacterium]